MVASIVTKIMDSFRIDSYADLMRFRFHQNSTLLCIYAADSNSCRRLLLMIRVLLQLVINASLRGTISLHMEGHRTRFFSSSVRKSNILRECYSSREFSGHGNQIYGTRCRSCKIAHQLLQLSESNNTSLKSILIGTTAILY